MFNRQEQVALLFLSGALLIGCAASVYDHYHPDALEDFRVGEGAVRLPDSAPSPDLDGGESQADRAPVAPEQADDEAVGRVDVNTASAAQMQVLPRIGPKTAERIVQFRRDNGPFATLDELRRVPGIGPRTVEGLRARAMVAPSLDAGN